MKRIIILICVVLLVLGSIYGYLQYNKTHEDVSKTKVDFNLSAPELYSEYNDNEDEANAKYLDKTIEITGKVSNIETENSSTKIYLDTGDDISSVMCEMDIQQDIAGTNIGDEVIIKGILAGTLMDIILNRCVIIKK